MNNCKISRFKYWINQIFHKLKFLKALIGDASFEFTPKRKQQTITIDSCLNSIFNSCKTLCAFTKLMNDNDKWLLNDQPGTSHWRLLYLITWLHWVTCVKVKCSTQLMQKHNSKKLSKSGRAKTTKGSEICANDKTGAVFLSLSTISTIGSAMRSIYIAIECAGAHTKNNRRNRSWELEKCELATMIFFFFNSFVYFFSWLDFFFLFFLSLPRPFCVCKENWYRFTRKAGSSPA